MPYIVKAAKSETATTIKAETAAKRLKDMISAKDQLIANVENLNVFFSSGNEKVGNICSVSTIPVYCCPNCKFCGRNCYDLRNDCCYPTVKNTRSINAAILEADRAKYFSQILEKVKNLPAFRWHIGGDITDANYFENVVNIARLVPTCKFLIFTKCFDIVNNWIDQNGQLPANLSLRFSLWKNQPCNNKHNLPVSLPIFAGDQEPENSYKCGGNCEHCLNSCCGCWNPEHKTVTFNAH